MEIKMKNETIDIKVNLKQVTDGSEYKGSITFGEQTFHYEIRFGLPLNALDELADIGPDEFTKRTELKVTNSKERDVILDGTTKQLFMGTVGKLAIEFYMEPRTREAQDGFMGEALRGDPLGLLGGFIEDAAIGMSIEYKLNRTPELEKFLESYRE